MIDNDPNSENDKIMSGVFYHAMFAGAAINLLIHYMEFHQYTDGIAKAKEAKALVEFFYD
jgi:hypothetical protein